MKTNTYGTYTYNGVTLTLLAPLWVFTLFQATLLGTSHSAEDRARLDAWWRQQGRLDKLQKRYEEERRRKQKPVIKILR